MLTRIWIEQRAATDKEKNRCTHIDEPPKEKLDTISSLPLPAIRPLRVAQLGQLFAVDVESVDEAAIENLSVVGNGSTIGAIGIPSAAWAAHVQIFENVEVANWKVNGQQVFKDGLVIVARVVEEALDHGLGVFDATGHVLIHVVLDPLGGLDDDSMVKAVVLQGVLFLANVRNFVDAIDFVPAHVDCDEAGLEHRSVCQKISR